MTREEILNQLKEWENAKLLFSQKSSGNRGYRIYAMIIKEKCYQTDKEFLYAVTKKVRDGFNALFRSGYVMSVNTAMERHPEYGTRTRFDRACAEGFALKTKICGVLLYIRGDEDEN